MAVIDHYLDCEAYGNAPDHHQYQGFKSWFDTAGQLWYFAAVTGTGRVVLRSRGYATEAECDNGIESVIKNRDIEERWTKEKGDEGYYMNLRADDRAEIARTCPFESEGALLGWWMPFTGLLAFGNADAAKSVSVVVPPAAPALPEVVVAPPPVTDVPEQPVTAPASGGNWWKWLLMLLLLAGLLLFFLFRR